MSACIYIEGGATGPGSKELSIRCQEAFHKLLDHMGFEDWKKKQPHLVACGGRKAVYDRFCIALEMSGGEYVAMWIDSEEPMANIEKAWNHLQQVTTVPRWESPAGAKDEQVLFMATCMETWIVADIAALKEHYGQYLQESALPPLVALENRDRHDVQEKLIKASRNCSNAYSKGKRSFDVLAKLNPATLRQHLPSFVRVERILRDKL